MQERRASQAGAAGQGGAFATQVRTRQLNEADAGVLARQVQIQLTRGNWEAAHAVIDQAKAWACGRREEAVAAVDTPLADLVSVRTAQALESNLRVIFAGQVLRFADEQLLAIPGFGPRALAEVDEALTRLGLTRFCKEPGA